MEELIAEHGITQEPREDHTYYINNWLHVLKQYSKVIITAASQLSKASGYLLKKSVNNQFEVVA